MFNNQPLEVEIYEDDGGERPFERWLTGLRDSKTRHRVDVRIARLRLGNPGDYKNLGNGLYELRLDFGSGYRIYCALAGNRVVLLLCGGDKATQQSDINQADKCWKDYQQRNPQ